VLIGTKEAIIVDTFAPLSTDRNRFREGRTFSHSRKQEPVSAGVGNQYGHLGPAAPRLFGTHSEKWYSTTGGKGQSLLTVAHVKTVSMHLFVV
jgi:hypothetical protein